MKLCMPSVLYLLFSASHIVMDSYYKQYNSVFVKILIALFFTFILNWLCEAGLSVISWIIILIPFVFMTLITSLLLYAFGFRH